MAMTMPTFLFSTLPIEIENEIEKNLQYRRDYDSVLEQLNLKIQPDFFSKWVVKHSLEELNEWWDTPLTRYEDTFEQLEYSDNQLAGTGGIYACYGDSECIYSIITDDYFDGVEIPPNNFNVL